MKTILAIWWFLSALAFGVFVVLIKAAGGIMDGQTVAGLALFAAFCGAFPPLRLAMYRRRNGTPLGTDGPVRLLLVLGCICAGFGVAVAAHRGGGYGGLIMLAGAGFLLGAVGVGLKRYFATPR